MAAQLALGMYSLNGNTVSAMTAASLGHGSLMFTASFSTTTGLISIGGSGTTSFMLLFRSGGHSATSAGYLLRFSTVDYVAALMQIGANVPILTCLIVCIHIYGDNNPLFVVRHEL